MNQTVNALCQLPLTSSGFIAASRKDGGLQKGNIIAIKGCMFSGKTTTLIATANMFKRCNVPVSIVAPDMSKRKENESDTIRSHDGVMPMCSTTYVTRRGLYEFCERFVERRRNAAAAAAEARRGEIEASDSSNVSEDEPREDKVVPVVLCIDEAQFFERLVDACRLLRRNGVVVVVAGLTLTYERKPFAEMHRLLDYADECVERKAVCGRCKSWNATLTHRTSAQKGDVVVGGAKEYMAACQNCFDALTDPLFGLDDED